MTYHSIVTVFCATIRIGLSKGLNWITKSGCQHTTRGQEGMLSMYQSYDFPSTLHVVWSCRYRSQGINSNTTTFSWAEIECFIKNIHVFQRKSLTCSAFKQNNEDSIFVLIQIDSIPKWLPSIKDNKLCLGYHISKDSGEHSCWYLVERLTQHIPRLSALVDRSKWYYPSCDVCILTDNRVRFIPDGNWKR